MGIVLNNFMIIGIMVICASGWLVTGLVFSNITKYIPDWRVQVKCGNKNLPMLKLINTGSRRVKFYPGIKNKPEDVVFEVTGYPGVLDPSGFAGGSYATPEIWGKNTEVYSYATDQPLPLSDRNARAIATIIKNVRKEIPRLNFLDDEILIELLGTKRNDLEHDVEMVLKSRREAGDYDDDVDLKELVKLIVDAQELANISEIETGFYSYVWAFKNIAYAYTPQFLKHFEMLTERKSKLKWGPERDKMMIFGIVIIGIICAAAVSVYILR